MQKRPVKLLKFLAAIVGIVLLAACSGDDDTLTDSTVTPPPSVSKNPTPGETGQTAWAALLEWQKVRKNIICVTLTLCKLSILTP